MLSRFLRWCSQLFDRTPVHLAIVRRYTDANGHFIGDLFMYDVFNGVGSYRMVGCSLDSLPLELMNPTMYTDADREGWCLDTEHDFLAPMPPDTVRVGAAEPKDNESVRRTIGRLPRRNIRLVIQNKFIEHVLERKA